MVAFRRRSRQQSLSPCSSSVSSPRENHRSSSTSGNTGGRGSLPSFIPCGCSLRVLVWGVLLLLVLSSVGLMVGNVSYILHYSPHLQLTSPNNNDYTKQNKNHYVLKQQQRRVSERSIEEDDEADEDRTEEAVWKRMMQRSTHARDSSICSASHPHRNDSLSLSWSHSMKDNHAPSHDAPKVKDSKGKWISVTKQHSPKKCQLPPQRSCDTTHVSVLVWVKQYDDDSSWRALTLHILQLLTYKTIVNDILILFTPSINHNDNSTSFMTFMKKDAKYGQRLLAWHANPNHIVRLIQYKHKQMEDHKPSLLSYMSLVTPKNDAVLWTELPREDDSKKQTDSVLLWDQQDQTSLQVGLELWKRNSRTLVASSSSSSLSSSHHHWMVPHAQSQMEATVQAIRNGSHGRINIDNKSQDKRKSKHRVGGLGQSIASSYQKKKDTLSPDCFLPICPSDPPRVSHEQKSFEGDNSFYQAVLDTSGMIFHREYLCFLSHPMFADVRHHVVERYPHDLLGIAFQALVSQVNGMAPMLYPPKPKYTPHNSLLMNETTSLATTNQRNTQSLEEEEEEDDDDSNDDDGWYDNDDDDDDDQTALLLKDLWAYFGSAAPGSVGWCMGAEMRDQDGMYRCEAPLNEPRYIPWMVPGGFGYDHCPQTIPSPDSI